MRNPSGYIRLWEPQQQPLPPLHFRRHNTMQRIIRTTNTSGKSDQNPNVYHMFLLLPT